MKNNSPVNSSAIIQATPQLSLTLPHPQPKITSGARYYRVFIILVWYSSSKVAEPKSITFIRKSVNDRIVEGVQDSIGLTKRIFSGYHKIRTGLFDNIIYFISYLP